MEVGNVRLVPGVRPSAGHHAPAQAQGKAVKPYLLADGRRIGVRGYANILRASQDAVARYDALTGGDIRLDSYARPIVAQEIAYELAADPFDVLQPLADALAHRAHCKRRF
jgi:hypothetical protein